MFCFATTGNVSVVEAAHNSGLRYYKEEREWQNLFALLDMLYGSGFLADLGERQLTAQELKLCYLVRAHLNNKAIALLFNVTTSSVVKAKQRLKRKLALLPSDSFDNYIQHY